MSQPIVKLFTTFGILNLALSYAYVETTPQAGSPEKAELRNVTLQNLNFKYMKDLYPDHTLLKIYYSKIDKIESNAFDGMSHLNLLEIFDSQVKTPIHPRTFLKLRSLEILVLENIGLKNVYLNLANVQELILKRNEIEILDGETITGKEINYLDVSDNKIRDLVGSLEKLVKLSMIDISRNQIAEIGNIFYHNFNLKRIIASENKLTSTENINLPWVKTLDLFSNKIAVLDANSFPNMTSLEELVLAFNNIKHLDDPFADLIELKLLNLGGNFIEEIHPSLFRNNLYLTKLKLHDNQIKSLERFESVHYHLTHLDLSHNHISLISDEFFQSMPNLQSLDISFNRLKTLTDSLAPLQELRILDLSCNNLVMNGLEFLSNVQLIRVNLSKNNIEIGLEGFKNNRMLTNLDLSNNIVSEFCEGSPVLKHLKKVNLRGNNVKSVECLKKFKSLCEVELRENPLTCDEELDSVTLGLARTGASPFAVADFHFDPLNTQCEFLTINRSFLLWNAVRRNLCGNVRDLETTEKESGKEEVAKEPEAERIDEKEVTTKKIPKKPFIMVPTGWIDKDGIQKPNPMDRPHQPQSGKQGWEKSEENAELLEGFEDEDNVRKANFSWYTIVLILIGLSFTLTCFNLAVFLFIKMKLWKKSEPGIQQKYTVLHNEVYKNTTEPSSTLPAEGGDWFLQNQTRNKIFSYGKINEFLLNFGLNKNDKDSESAKNVLISSSR